jgi:hypothetical protein
MKDVKGKAAVPLKVAAATPVAVKTPLKRLPGDIMGGGELEEQAIQVVKPTVVRKVCGKFNYSHYQPKNGAMSKDYPKKTISNTLTQRYFSLTVRLEI